MLVSDYIFRRLALNGVRDVFMVSGGGIMHLVDALGRQSSVRYWCNHHEQACAIAAEAYARVTGGIGACLVTTGPGSTNALSGVAGAWVDSIPVVVVSGQVRTGIIADYKRVRQLGPQEIDSVSMARHVTKRAETVMSADLVPVALDRALRDATSGRPGPVWLDLPLDVQGATLDADPPSGSMPDATAHTEPTPADIRGVLRELEHSERPLLVCGNGVHLAHAEQELLALVDRLDCPVVTTIGGMDLIPEDDAHCMGRFGPTGLRRANFAVQNADLLVCVGTSMSIATVGFDTTKFAPQARRVMVNVDPEEFDRPNFHTDVGCASDAKAFLQRLFEEIEPGILAWDPEWAAACREWKRQYPRIVPEYFDHPAFVNSYVLAARLSDLLSPGDVILTGNSLDAVSVFHSFGVKAGQRLLTNSNYGAMGWDLPAAVGAAVARPDVRTVLVTGDGSFQFNSQELLTIGHAQLGVKIFVLCNGGYESIRTMQETHFDGRLVGCHDSSGVGMPNFRSLAKAYGLSYAYLGDHDDLERLLPPLLDGHSPLLCEVHVSPKQKRTPRIVSRMRREGALETPSLEHQFPLLPDEETGRIMSRFSRRHHDR